MSTLNKEDPKQLVKQLELWEDNEVNTFLNKQPEREDNFYTLGGFPVKRTYTALDTKDIPIDDIGLPGQYPFHEAPILQCTEADTGPCAKLQDLVPVRIRIIVLNT
jgi:methylmalonyl-CoA mutase N-terminal domain/subunit